MASNRTEHPRWHHKINIVMTALAFIVVGLLLLGREMDIIDPEIVNIIVSWQMLLIFIGLGSLYKRNLVSGLIIIFVGVYFLLPELDIRFDWAYSLWPIMLILIGVAILFKLAEPKSRRKTKIKRIDEENINKTTENGFIKADVSFGSSKHIVLDPVFKGAEIDISFGNVSLDLRRTKLDGELTFIEVDCSFGGFEILIPSSWNVVIDVDTTLSGCEDKRFPAQEIDSDHKLVIRGDISFSGIEIKN